MTKKLFVILAEPRTGTSLVNDRMLSFQNIFNLGEIHDMGLTALRTFFDKSLDHVVVKVLSTQLSLAEIEKLVSWPEVEIIYIKRQDKLATYVSWIKAYEYNLWNNVDTSDFKITIDPEHYAKWYINSVSWHEHVDDIIKSKRVLHIVYERDLENFSENEFLLRIQGWFNCLGIQLSRSSHTRTWGMKQNSKPIENSINNYSVIEKTYKRY